MPMPSTLLLVFVSLAVVPSSMALRVPSALSTLAVQHAPAHSPPPRTGQAPMMRAGGKKPDGGSYLSNSADAWAKTAKERPAFFVVRVALLGSGLYFFATLAGALVQRAL